MRTAVTLDDDVIASLRTGMCEQGLSFKEALNSAVLRKLELGWLTQPCRTLGGSRAGLDGSAQSVINVKTNEAEGDWRA